MDSKSNMTCVLIGKNKIDRAYVQGRQPREEGGGTGVMLPQTKEHQGVTRNWGGEDGYSLRDFRGIMSLPTS